MEKVKEIEEIVVNSSLIETYDDLRAMFDAHFLIYIDDLEIMITSKYAIKTLHGFQSVAVDEGFNYNYSYELERLATLIYKNELKF